MDTCYDASRRNTRTNQKRPHFGPAFRPRNGHKYSPYTSIMRVFRIMFAENSDYQEEIVAVGDIGKIETSVPSHFSGKDSSEVRVGLRKDNVVKSNLVKVDKKILAAGHHHGATYFEHLAFINSIHNNAAPEVSLRDGLMSVAIGEAAEQSIKEGRVVDFKEFNL